MYRKGLEMATRGPFDFESSDEGWRGKVARSVDLWKGDDGGQTHVRQADAAWASDEDI